MKNKKTILSYLKTRFESLNIIFQERSNYIIHAVDKKEYYLRILPRSIVSDPDSLKDLMNISPQYLIFPLIKTEIYEDCFIVYFEHKPSLSLNALMKIHRTLPPRVGLIIFIQILLCLHYLHESNYNHSFLIPDNIFISDGEIRLIDYGFINTILPSNKARLLYNNKSQFLSRNILAGENPDQTSDIDNALNILSYILKGTIMESYSFKELIDILNLGLDPYHDIRDNKILQLSYEILYYHKESSLYDIIRAFLNTNILLNILNTHSPVFRKIHYKTRKFIIDHGFYYQDHSKV